MRHRGIETWAVRVLAWQHGARPGETVEVRCSYCGKPGTVEWWLNLNGSPYHVPRFHGLEIDHVIPRCRGGSSDLDNLAIACRHCNRSKGGR